MAIRWQVVQRSRTWLFSTTSFSTFTCHTSPPRGFSFCERSVTFVRTLASSVRNSHSIVAAASTSSVSGCDAHFLTRAWTAEAPRLGDQATGVVVVLARSEQQAFGPELPQRQQPRLDVRVVLGVVAGEDRVAGDVEDAAPPPVVEDQARRASTASSGEIPIASAQFRSPLLLGVTPS